MVEMKWKGLVVGRWWMREVGERLTELEYPAAVGRLPELWEVAERTLVVVGMKWVVLGWEGEMLLVVMVVVRLCLLVEGLWAPVMLPALVMTFFRFLY